ncbi:uncharacterized protein BYT42DRAFT_603782 [Radiomyces spectabilis]|uniref:uncharacterized protein n=1 Tax=Radiomyces spectabilis TaxID=64574 RepID=UPI00221FA0C9|nr:uncharacterized protein BYT42DRAFT_603782 [Radiomyces spectabilis]KAI8384808.1 hypothetical protein BYT42DRAFT_603782 [Radiomyces spectabilis]
MPYTPYTLQTIVASTVVDEPLAKNTSSSSPTPTAPSQSSPAVSLLPRISTPPLAEPVPSKSQVTPSRLNALLSGNTANAANIPRFTIDSVEAWETDLYVGTSDGHILHYALEETTKQDQTNDIPYVSKLENRINLGYGKKSVERILVIPQVSKAVVLCDSTLSFYSLPFLDPIPVSLVTPIKGVSCFSHDLAMEGRIGEDGTVGLCVIKRRAIQIYKIGETMQLKKELPLADGALTVTRHSRHLCLADTQQYKLVNLQVSIATPLIPTPQVPTSPSTSSSLLGSGTHTIPRPIVAVVKEGEFLVVSGSVNNQTTIGIFVDAFGDAIRGTIQWSSYPKAVTVEFPYMAALLRNQTIEIHNILDQQRLQVIHLNPAFEARGMSFSHGIKVYMDGLAKPLRRRPWGMAAANGDDNAIDLESMLRREVARYSTVPARILLYGKSSVMAQLATPLVMQVDRLLDTHRIEEAMEMADQAGNTMPLGNNVYAERLRNELDYIYQKSGLLLLKETLFDDAFSMIAKGNMDPRIIISLFGDLFYPKWLNTTPPALLYDGVRELVDGLGKIEDIVANNIERNYSPHVEDDDAQRPSPTMELRRALLNNAREAMLKYLLSERGKRRAILGRGDIACIAVDTALLKLFIINKDEHAIYRILREPNDCAMEECESALMKSKRYYALSMLYESKHLYEKLLEIWTKIYSGELADPEFKDGLSRIKRLLLQDVNTHELPLSVIVHYAWWLTEQNAADGVEVFIRSPHATEMDSGAILEKLETYGHAIVQDYLEYLVLIRRSDHAEYHTRLARSYVYNVRDEIARHGTDEIEKLISDYKQSVDPMRTQMLSPSSASSIEVNLTFVGYLGYYKQTNLVRLRLALIRLLQRSRLYSPPAIMEALKEAGPLDVERAIVYGRMGHHEEALNVLIHTIGDFVGAETYCVTNGNSTGVIPDDISVSNKRIPPARTSSLAQNQPPPPDTLPTPPEESTNLSPEEYKERRQLLSLLLKTYLGIKEPSLMVARTMHLLNTQGFYLEILEVLNLIPNEWPIDMLQNFLIRSLRRSFHAYREGQIILGLSRGENLMVGSELIEVYKDIGPVTVDLHDVCEQCQEYLGPGPFVRESRYGQLLHLDCAQKLGLCKQ